MEARVLQGFPSPTGRHPYNTAKPRTSLQHFIYEEQGLYKVPASCNLTAKKGKFHGNVVLKVSCSSGNARALVLESGTIPAFLDEPKSIQSICDLLRMILPNKSEEIEPYLNGHCIYLVGMMGSGKTTIGKVLAEALGYSFCDCDALIEEVAGGSTVTEIFKLYGENFFRDNETEVLQKLSLIRSLVVSTGGGAVVGSVNWRHMRKGISVWLDVLLEALARRITAVGTDSRPLLHHESGDLYSKTMNRLSTLFEERGEAYATADVRVSFENLAVKLGFEDVCNLIPTAIAFEVLLLIENFFKK